ncbi:hypothetical protein NRIC_33960 [Enterococcus florum]|uniref:Uncharacterized protein n=1 Tax=Enterococcus florum TaxID=2480627 RepID=A0A4P5PBE8_9ENTE|nr:hypothetical protein [Enterococcus florum]GCF95505.1 hypothetical protein NRIC_33960 [Enterococcus florum]
MKPVFTIFISEPNFFRRQWLKKVIRKFVSDFDKKLSMQMIVCKKLTDIKPRMALISTRNIYFLTTDLSKKEDLKELQKIKKKNSQGNIILFIKDKSYLIELFRHKIPILDYRELRCPRDEQLDMIKSSYYYILDQLGYVGNGKKTLL